MKRLNQDYQDSRIFRICVAAGLVLALAFTFSCSSDDGGGGNTNTYFYSQYGIPLNSTCCAELDEDDDNDDDGRPSSDYTFDEIYSGLREALSECSGSFLRAISNITEDSLRAEMAKAGSPPAYRDKFISDLNRRGNNIRLLDVRNNPSCQQKPSCQKYCAVVEYFEKE